MARRREGMAPYEIMGSAPPTGAPSASDEPVVPRRGFVDHLRDLWDTGVPIVVRVPRGVAVLVCVGVLGLIVLSYWVGYSRGRSAAETAMADQVAELERAVGRAPQMAGRPAPLPDLTATGAGDEGLSRTPQGSRSGQPAAPQPGLNYLILARYPRLAQAEAERLVDFLRSRGVESAVVPADNAGFLHVVGLRGFTTDEYRAGAHTEYERQMRQLGRDWRAFNAGRGQNLSDMYWKLHTGPP